MDSTSGSTATSLSQRDARRLRSALRNAEDVRVFKRALALCLLAEGAEWAAVIRTSTLCRGTVSFWLHRYLSSRSPLALEDLPRPGRPPQLSLPPSRLLRVLDSDPHRLGYSTHTWTAPLLAFHLRERYGQRLSARTLRRNLHALGWRWKRPRYVFAQKAAHLAQKKWRSFGR